MRDYELLINERKTSIQKLPLPAESDWKATLKAFRFREGEIGFGGVRDFLGLAISLSATTGKSSVIFYAFKMLPDRLSDRAKKLFTQEACSLSLCYPYLAPHLDEYVFEKHRSESTNKIVRLFSDKLFELSLKKVYPDAIAHAVHLALKYDFTMEARDLQLIEAVQLSDCISNVLILEYARLRDRTKVVRKLNRFAEDLKKEESRDRDRQWLLLYQLWDEANLRGNNQAFLADLKAEGFGFLKIQRSAPNHNKESNEQSKPDP